MEEPKITHWDVLEEEPLLEYVRLLANKCYPHVEPDYEGEEESDYPEWFVKRYKSNLIDIKFNYADFCARNKYDSIAKILDAFGLEIEKFWFLLLFAYDLAVNVIIESKETPKDELDRFADAVLRNLKRNGYQIDFTKSMELTLKIDKEKHAIKVKSPLALAYLALAIDYCDFSEIKDAHLKAALRRYDSHPLGLKPEEHEKRTPTLIFFTALMRKFLYDICKEQNIQGPEQSAYSQTPKDKMLLISKLAWFTKLAEEDKFNESAESLKSLWKTLTYKNMNVQQRNRFYTL